MAITPTTGYEIDPNAPNRVRRIGEQTMPDLGSISSANLSGQPAPNFTQPNQVPVYPVAGLNPAMQMTEGEQRAESGFSDLQELNKMLIGESGYRGEQETVQDVAGKTQAVNDLSSRLKTLQNEALAIPLQLQQDATGRGVTAGGLRPIETATLRNNAIQALSTNSLLEAARGNLTTAQSLADRAVAQKYDPIREAINATKTNLELIMNSPSYTLQQKNRAQAQLDIQNEKARQVEKQAEDEKAVRSIALTAQKYGASADVVQKILNASSYNDAQVLAGTYLQDPMAKQELLNAGLDYKLKQAQIDRIRKETQLLGEPTKKETQETKKALLEAQSAIPVMQDKIAAVSTLASHAGLSNRVGVGIFDRGVLPAGQGGIAGTIARIGSVAGIPSLVASGIDVLPFVGGKGQDFAGGVHKLTSGLNLQELIEAKSRGATFGALSNQELRVLASAASSISDWEIKRRVDGEDVPTGFWDIDEASFKRELETIKTLTQRAIERSGGKVITNEDQAIIDSLYQVDSFNPAF